MRTSLHIDQLCCMEEVLQLRAHLESRPGVSELEFDVVNRRLTVEHDEDRISEEVLVDKVAEIGMTARTWQSTRAVTEPGSWRDNLRLLATVTSGLGLVAGLLWHTVSAGDLAAAIGHSTLVTTAAERPVDQSLPFPAAMLYALSILSGVWFVVPKAWLALRRLRPDMNLLMLLAIAGALVLGEYLEAASVAFLFALALLLEHWSMGRARRAIARLMDLTPATARCVEPGGGPEYERPVEEVEIGQLVQVRPGEKIPLDGVVRQGESAVNQAPITGESLPVEKEPGSTVYAGTINGHAALQLEVTRRFRDTTLSRIVEMVQQAQARRAPTQQWVERFAQYYTPAMIALAVAIAIIPPLLAGASWNAWFYNALVVLVIACPCALVISTPVSIVSALTAAARQGILIKGGRYLEAAAQLPALALDKTGTLTDGRPVVQQILPVNGYSRERLLALASGMEAHSSHPIAHAVRQYGREQGVTPARVQNYRMLSGRGAEGEVDGRQLWIGGQRLLEERRADLTDELVQLAGKLQEGGESLVALGDQQQVYGLIAVADSVRAGVAETISELRRLGVRHIVMLTGDNPASARKVAELSGVDEALDRLLPEDKADHVRRLRDQYGSIAMIGDGINDGPAMAESTVAIAMGAIGTDMAIETADVALMSDDLTRIPWLIRHARRTRRIIQQNIALALGLKLFFLALAIGGIAWLWMAIAADMGASLLVIFNGLRLLGGEGRRKGSGPEAGDRIEMTPAQHPQRETSATT